MGKDLGTYHIVVEYYNARGFIYKWETGTRFTKGSDRISPISAQEIPPCWETEEDLVESMIYQFVEGNYACDCNAMMFIAEAYQEESVDFECGETLQLERLTLLRPDGSTEVIWEEIS